MRRSPHRTKEAGTVNPSRPCPVHPHAHKRFNSRAAKGATADCRPRGILSARGGDGKTAAARRRLRSEAASFTGILLAALQRKERQQREKGKRARSRVASAAATAAGGAGRAGAAVVSAASCRSCDLNMEIKRIFRAITTKLWL